MKLFIDTEFDGYKGGLISMGIISEDDRAFYEVLTHHAFNPWVRENVIPILGKEPISFEDFQQSLLEYLKQFSSFTIVADWPDDLKYFCDAIITAPGEMIAIPSFETQIIREINSNASKVPHNALEDAIAIKGHYLSLQTGKYV